MKRLRPIVIGFAIVMAARATGGEPEQINLTDVHGNVAPFAGLWTVDTLGNKDGQHTKPGYAAFSGCHGLISNAAGTAPFVFQFRVANVQNQQWIDLAVPGDRDTTLYGIYELDKERLKLCFATEDIVAVHGRPKSFSEADPQKFNRVVLVRVPQSR